MILGTVQDLEDVHIEEWELHTALLDYLTILCENYGYDRNIYEDDGGYALVIEDEEGWDAADEYVSLETDTYEFAEKVGRYIKLFKLCNNEFSIVIFVRRDVCPSSFLKALQQEYGNL